MKTNRLDGCPSTLFLTLVICLVIFSMVIIILEEVMHQEMLRMSQKKSDFCMLIFKSYLSSAPSSMKDLLQVVNAQLSCLINFTPLILGAPQLFFCCKCCFNFCVKIINRISACLESKLNVII